MGLMNAEKRLEALERLAYRRQWWPVVEAIATEDGTDPEHILARAWELDRAAERARGRDAPVRAYAAWMTERAGMEASELEARAKRIARVQEQLEGVL